MKRSNTGDDIFVRAAPAAAFRMIASLPRDYEWWPRSRFSMDGNRLSARLPAGRARRAVRFTARVDGVREGETLAWSFETGQLRGRGQWWFEPAYNGTMMHYYLEAEPGTRGRGRRLSARVRRHRVAVRRGMNIVKDRLEHAAGAAHV